MKTMLMVKPGIPEIRSSGFWIQHKKNWVKSQMNKAFLHYFLFSQIFVIFVYFFFQILVLLLFVNHQIWQKMKKKSCWTGLLTHFIYGSSGYLEPGFFKVLNPPLENIPLIIFLEKRTEFQLLLQTTSQKNWPICSLFVVSCRNTKKVKTNWVGNCDTNLPLDTTMILPYIRWTYNSQKTFLLKNGCWW